MSAAWKHYFSYSSEHQAPGWGSAACMQPQEHLEPSENCTGHTEVGEWIEKCHNCFYFPFLRKFANEFELKPGLLEFGYTSNTGAITPTATHLKWQEASCLLFPVWWLHTRTTSVVRLVAGQEAFQALAWGILVWENTLGRKYDWKSKILHLNTEPRH